MKLLQVDGGKITFFVFWTVEGKKIQVPVGDVVSYPWKIPYEGVTLPLLCPWYNYLDHCYRNSHIHTYRPPYFPRQTNLKSSTSEILDQRTNLLLPHIMIITIVVLEGRFRSNYGPKETSKGSTEEPSVE